MNKTIGTVCFIVNDHKVLLAEIAYPDGRILWNGIGGVVEPGETPEQAVSREISEETELIVDEKDVQKATVKSNDNLELHIFTTTKWAGELETVEPTLRQLKWFDFNAVPYSQMHPGNDAWLPDILNFH